MKFLNVLKDKLNKTSTFNGAKALKSTNSGLVDLFGSIGSLRNRNEVDIENLFSKAFSEDSLLAMKILFYARDIRGGLGERRVSRILYKHLGKVYPDILKQNLGLISHYGRWDDLNVLLDTKLRSYVIEIINIQLAVDLQSDVPSLLAKWLPSINTSSNTTKNYAKIIMEGLNWNAKKYRQTLSALRKKIDVLEVKMSAGMWTEIDYRKVPSNAMNLYSKAFINNDEERFKSYIEAVKSGDEKINSSVLYPYNITEKILYGKTDININVLEQQWNSMPDFVLGNTNNVMVMADVSGSMFGRPMATSIGLALYFAQRSKGAFAGHFMTFSESPSIIQITGDTLYEQVRMVLSSNWGVNTDFEKALRIILDTAVRNNLEQAELPKTLIVVTDMQFDRSIQNTNKDWTFYKKMKRMYSRAGFTIPEIVFWNVNSMSNVFQVLNSCEGVKLASGQSASVFKSILNSRAMTPYDFMLEVLNDERYKQVVA
ncbi:DUF2828 family protein [Clostridium sp. 'deep sea']|uniref:DUF2828 family protein n=1 Tax=Clostridium sp. 'deep sea' TaxID=2779445 RepID=UPI001896A2E0|nr:DUF2828 family protein [Clostridium sp. 'deep sea']QOR35175.1 DUF2828 family protein [Clostridium sp. 'deep sea']